MTGKRFIILAVLALMLTLSCTKPESNLPDWPWQDPEEVIPSEPQPEPTPFDNWKDVSSEYGTLPAYIKVYKSPETLQGKAAIAYIAVADMNSAKWDIWSVKSDNTYETADSYKRPSDVYKEGSWPIVINGGYFFISEGKNYTSSLAVRNSEVLAYNINYASEDWVNIYYPTRAAFLELENGTFDACWTYLSGTGHYMYPAPAANSWSNAPLKFPDASSPEGAVKFAAKTGIGAGPVLVDNGKFTDSYVAELFNGTSGIGPDSNQPRTAVGITADKKMIFFVCEGRQMTSGISGLTTADVANVLIDLGCVEAINLDGGGSSCMLVNGKETIKVSDGSQRSVASTLMLK